MKLFLEIKETKGISYVFISHDFHVVRYISDWILVLYNGRMVEYARSDKLFEQPLHPYTRELLRAIPNIRKTNIEAVSYTHLDVYKRQDVENVWHHARKNHWL